MELQKNQITLLKAIKDIDNVNLIIIGYGSQEKKLKDFIKKNMLKNKVYILKNINNPYPFFKIADLFILSSVYEGFPNVLTEAIMLKVPIISSNCKSGPSEILMKKKGPQIFEKENYIDLKKKILSHLKKKQVICSRQKNLYASLKRFDKMTSAIQELIDERVDLAPKKIKPRHGTLAATIGTRRNNKGRF